MISPSVVPPEPGAPAPLVLRHAAPYAYDLGTSPDSGSAAMVEERLPFSVRVVGDAETLHKAVYIRHAAYARHVPDLARNLQQPEAADFADGAVVLLAESHLDGSPLGTMRIQTNRYAPLALEESLPLPPELSGSLLAEATRLGVAEGREGTLVKTVLFKAFYLYCLHSGIDWMVVTGRAPIDRQYLRMLFEDVYPERGYIPMGHVGNLPHRVLKFEVRTAQERWAQVHHPLLKFMVETHHPDILLGMPVEDSVPDSAPAPMEFAAPLQIM